MDVNNGIRASFQFASPENRRATGPLERFAGMILFGYGCLVNCRAFALFPLSAALAESYGVNLFGADDDEEEAEDEAGGGRKKNDRAQFFVWVHFERKATSNDLRFRAAADSPVREGGRFFLWSMIRKHRLDPEEAHLSGCWLTAGVADVTDNEMHQRFMAEASLGTAGSYARFCRALKGEDKGDEDADEDEHEPIRLVRPQKFPSSVFQDASEDGAALSPETIASIQPLVSSCLGLNEVECLRCAEYWV